MITGPAPMTAITQRIRVAIGSSYSVVECVAAASGSTTAAVP